MSRHAALVAVLWFLIAAVAAEAQPVTKVPRIGFVEAGSRSANQHLLDAFRKGLRDLRYVDGQNIIIEDRWADGRADRFPELISELIRLKVDVLVVASTPGAGVAKRITNTVPVVVWGVSDPVGIGVVASLARPGGNITGVALGTEDGLPGKRVELLKEALPVLARVAVLWNPNARSLEPQVKELQAAAATRKLTLHIFEVRNVSELEGAFSAMSKTRVGGLIVVVDPLTFRHREDIVRLATQARLPAISGFSEFARLGGLMAYGPSAADQATRAAAYVDKILQGAKPADLPVERPTRFEFVINMRTVKALGLTISPSLLLRADQVVD
jgi:ABC-type uncharacterized transport system substrate-binding protein